MIGFSGRVLSGDEKTAKYVNSPETPIFTKSKVFFGLDKSKRAMLDAGLRHRLRRAARPDRLLHGGRAEHRRARRAPRSPPTTPASSSATWTRSCCASIRTTPGRTRPSGRWTTCWRPAWRCAWPWCPRRMIRTASSRPTAARPSSSSSSARKASSTIYLNRLCATNEVSDGQRAARPCCAARILNRPLKSGSGTPSQRPIGPRKRLYRASRSSGRWYSPEYIP